MMSLTLDHLDVAVPDGPDVLQILSGVSLQVAPGEVVAITGASGSGKSTLLAVAGLLRRPDAGAVRIDDVDVTDASRRERTRLRRDSIGLVLQSSSLFPSLTALEQVELVAHMAGRLDRAARARAAALLDEVGLGDRSHHRPAELSGGERQRVGIARALMNEPSVLLADEPTAALDADRGRAVMELLSTEARRRQVAMVVVTHAPDQLVDVDRHLHLAAGHLSPVPPGATV
jgi:putative ABC transport system ATP-binding protein